MCHESCFSNMLGLMIKCRPQIVQSVTVLMYKIPCLLETLGGKRNYLWYISMQTRSGCTSFQICTIKLPPLPLPGSPGTLIVYFCSPTSSLSSNSLYLCPNPYPLLSMHNDSQHSVRHLHGSIGQLLFFYYKSMYKSIHIASKDHLNYQ